MLKEIDSLDKTSVKAFEEFLFRYREILHEKNTHVLQVKYALTQLYGNAPGFSLLGKGKSKTKQKNWNLKIKSKDLLFLNRNEWCCH